MADAERRQQKTETLATLHVGKLKLERRNGALTDCDNVDACSLWRTDASVLTWLEAL